MERAAPPGWWRAHAALIGKCGAAISRPLRTLCRCLPGQPGGAGARAHMFLARPCPPLDRLGLIPGKTVKPSNRTGAPMSAAVIVSVWRSGARGMLGIPPRARFRGSGLSLILSGTGCPRPPPTTPMVGLFCFHPQWPDISPCAGERDSAQRARSHFPCDAASVSPPPPPSSPSGTIRVIPTAPARARPGSSVIGMY